MSNPKKMVVDLKAVQALIPRSKDGDPAFQFLEEGDDHPESYDHAVLSIFTPEQVVAMVNRYLYQAEYQQQAHLDYAAKRRAFEKPIKEAAKRLFPQTSFINLTPEQLNQAVEEAYGKKGE